MLISQNYVISNYYSYILTIAYIRYAAEVQQVHEAPDGSRAVVAILFKYGPPSPFIDMVMKLISQHMHYLSYILPPFLKDFYPYYWS